MVDEILVPVGTRDFSAILLKAQQIKADVVAPAIGGDDFKSMRQQIIDQGLDKKLRFSGGAVPDWPDVWPLGPTGVFGVFPTTWYHYLDLPGVAEFNAKYKQKFPNAPEPVPGNVFYNGYYAMRELIRTIERVGLDQQHQDHQGARGPTRCRRAIACSTTMPGSTPTAITSSRPCTWAPAISSRGTPTDLFKIIGMAKPEDVVSETEKECKLETYEATPTYEM